MDYTDNKRELCLMQQTYGALMSVAKKLNRQDNVRFDGLTARQCVIILVIMHSPKGESSISNIAKKLGTTKQNISQIIPVLENKGYVSKSVNLKNKRTACVRVTDSGNDAMMQYVGASAAFMSEIFADFTCGELITILRLLEKLYRYDGKNCSSPDKIVVNLFDSEQAP